MRVYDLDDRLVKTKERVYFHTLNLLDWVLGIYFVTTNINVFSAQFSAALQNITYILFIAGTLYLGSFKIRLSAYFKHYGAFILFALASAFWSISQSGTMTLIRILLKEFVICVILASHYNSSDRTYRAIKVIYYSLIAVVTYVSIFTPIEDWTSAMLGKDFGIDTVRYAVRTSLCAVLAVYLFIISKNRIHLIVGFTTLILSLITAKRTGVFFFAIAVLIYYLVLQPNASRRIKTLVIFAIVVVVAFQIIDSVPILSITIGQRLEDFAGTIFGGQTIDTSTIQRSILMEYAFALFKQNPVFGSGLNALRAYLGTVNYEHITYAHNNYLEIASGLGIVGFLLYYVMYWYGISGCNKLLKVKRRRDIAIILALIIAFLACDMMQVVYESYFEIAVLAILVTGVQNAIEEQAANSSVERD